MVYNLIPLAVLFIGAISIAVTIQKSFEEVLPTTLMGMVLIIYFFGLADKLSMGFYMIPFVSLVLLVISIFRNHKTPKVYFNLITPGFIVFLLLAMIIFLLDRNRAFYQWDDFSHWGVMIKETIRLGSFYSVPESILSFHKDYPPFMTLFESFWITLRGSYREDAVFIALHLFSLSLFMPFFKNLKWEKKTSTFLKLAFGLILIFHVVSFIQLEDADFIRTIYLDPLIALLFAYSMALIIRQRQLSIFHSVQLSITLTFLLMVKEIGLFFYCLALLFFILTQFFYRVDSKDQLNIRRFSFTILSITLIPALIYISWKVNLSNFNYVGQFSLSKIQLSELWNILNGTTGQTYKLQVVTNFFDAFFNKPLLNLFSPSFFTLTIINFIVFLGFSMVITDYKEKRILRFTSAYLFFSSFLYALVMLVLYLFTFSQFEALNLASYTRYMNTYWYSMVALLGMLTIDMLGHEKFKLWKFIPLVLFLGFLFSFQVGYPDFINKWLHNGTIIPSEQIYIEDISILEEYTQPNSKIIVIDQNSTPYLQNILRYQLNGRNIGEDFVSLGQPYDENDHWTVDLDIHEFAEALRSYDYLYLYDIDDQFYSLYFPLFDQEFYVEDQHLYEIIKSDPDKIELKSIYRGDLP